MVIAIFLSNSKKLGSKFSTGPDLNALAFGDGNGMEIVHLLSTLSKVVPSEKMAKKIWPIDVASIEYNALLKV